MLPSLVLECRIHYLDLSVVRPGGYGNLSRKASARAQRISLVGSTADLSTPITMAKRHGPSLERRAVTMRTVGLQ